MTGLAPPPGFGGEATGRVRRRGVSRRTRIGLTALTLVVVLPFTLTLKERDALHQYQTRPNKPTRYRLVPKGRTGTLDGLRMRCYTVATTAKGPGVPPPGEQEPPGTTAVVAVLYVDPGKLGAKAGAADESFEYFFRDRAGRTWQAYGEIGPELHDGKIARADVTAIVPKSIASQVAVEIDDHKQLASDGQAPVSDNDSSDQNQQQKKKRGPGLLFAR